MYSYPKYIIYMLLFFYIIIIIFLQLSNVSYIYRMYQLHYCEFV